MRDYPPMVVADRETFLALRRILPAATKTCLRETFGVSETTWVKLRDSRPVKVSTLERVLTRYRWLSCREESRASDRQTPDRRISAHGAIAGTTAPRPSERGGCSSI